MKKLIIGALLVIIPQIAFCQKSDSTKLYSIQKWKLDILLDAKFYDLPACKTSLEYSDSLTTYLNIALNYSDSLSNLRAYKIELQGIQVNSWELRYNNVLSIHEESVKRLKGQKTKITLIAIGEAILIVLLVL